jgi:hypothetical protein
MIATTTSSSISVNAGAPPRRCDPSMALVCVLHLPAHEAAALLPSGAF